jgi:hypothetical protein
VAVVGQIGAAALAEVKTRVSRGSTQDTGGRVQSLEESIEPGFGHDRPQGKLAVRKIFSV